MLPLDDPRWHQLSSLGGSKAPLLAALRELEDAPEQARIALGEIAVECCHQGSSYQTTVAVMPYLVRAAAKLPPSHANRREVLGLAGYFTLLLHAPRGTATGQTVTLPEILEQGYADAVRAALPLTAESLREDWNERDFSYLLAALCAFKGQRRLGGLLTQTVREVVCPSCHEEIDALVTWGEVG